MEELLDCFTTCDLERLELIIKKRGINNEVPGTEGFTALHVIAGIDTLDNIENVMAFLFENKADPNAKSDENLTPVHIAAMWNRCFQLKELLQHGGDPFVTDNENKNSFDMAADNHCYEALKLLHTYYAESTEHNFESKQDEYKKIIVTSESFSTPRYFENSKISNLNISPDMTFMTAKESKELKIISPALFSTPCNPGNNQTANLNDTANVTFMTANDSKFVSPAPFSTPIYHENYKTCKLSNSVNDTCTTEKEANFVSPVAFITPRYLENSKNVNDFASSTFLSAKEFFPLILSSNDENDEEYSSDASEFLNKLNLNKCTQHVKVKENTEKDECANKNSTYIVSDERKSEEKVPKCKLNKAYIFTSSSDTDTSDTATSDLNESSNSSYGTIIDCSDNSGIVLIETKNDDNNLYSSNASLCNVPNDWKSYHNITSDCSTLSYCSSHSKSTLTVPDEVQTYSNSKIFQELRNLGDNPGPVLDHTRHVYLHRLARLISGCIIACELPKPKYCPEIYLFLENKLDMERAHYLEKNIEEEFDAETSKEWREGNQRCCFNYFLLDPRVTQQLSQRASQLSKEQIFLTFLDALFYVGKGTRGRPYSHLFEAAKSLEVERPKSNKVNHILDIWDAGLGVISLHCFHNSIPVEAYTREACIIEAVGLDNLTNVKKGDFYGLSAKLTSSRKRLIGISLLYKALQIFLLDGERFIKPKDIKNK